MDDFFLQIGQDAAITVFIDGEVICGVIHKRKDEFGVHTDVYVESNEALAVAADALAATLTSLDAYITKPAVDELIRAAIRRMEEQIAGEEGEPPSPADDLGDIPF